MLFNKQIVVNILKIAFPATISNLSVPLLTMSDTFFAGKLDAGHSLAALSIGGLIVSIIFWGLCFFRIHSLVQTAKNFGAKNYKKINQQLQQNIIIAFLTGVILMTLIPVLNYLTHFIFPATEPKTLMLCKQYFEIIIISSPAILVFYVLVGYLFGLQKGFQAMALIVSVNVLNVILNYVFVEIFSMNIKGLAYACLISQSLVVLITIYILRKNIFPFKLKEFFANNEFVKSLKQNSQFFIRTIFLIVTFLMFKSESAKIGDYNLAANEILLQLWLLYSYTVDGLANSAESLIGEQVGLKNKKNILLIVKELFKVGIVTAVIFTLIYWAAIKNLIGLFSANIEILTIANEYSFWIILTPILCLNTFILDGVFIGLYKMKELLNSIAVATFLVFIPLVLIATKFLGNHGPWLALTLFIVARGLLLLKYYLAKNNGPV